MRKLREKIISLLMSKKGLNYMTLSNNVPTPSRMSLPVWGVHATAILCIVLIVTAWSLYGNYRLMSSEYQANLIEVENLRTINSQQSNQIDTINLKINENNEKLAKLAETDTKIRLLIQ